MTTPTPTTSDQVVPDSIHRESAWDFIRWAAAALRLPVREQNGTAWLEVPEPDQSIFDGQAELQLSLGNTASAGATESMQFDSRLCQWLIGRLRGTDSALPTRPVNQPTAVKDIADRLFAAYSVDGGNVHLGGCQLTDLPFLRLSFASEAGDEVRHLFVAHDGSSVSDRLAKDLGLLQVEPILKLPPRIDEPAVHSLVTAGRRVAAQSVTSRDPNTAVVEPTLVTVVWVKHASGTLNFTIGENTVSLPFSGWAKTLAAQPYTSPASGASGFHLAATDDGRIDSADQIDMCQQSGKRVLRQDLVRCATTGKLVLEEFTDTCSVTGQHSLTEHFAECEKCRQLVSKAAFEESLCAACVQMAKIKNDDPRLVWILGEHAGLERWRNWQLAETKSVYVAQASTWTKRLLVVVDKETLAVDHLATAGKFGSYWAPASESQRIEILR
ncbi:MAG: hypothetical protein AAGD11_03155 [Planctomycetota bacterium]